MWLTEFTMIKQQLYYLYFTTFPLPLYMQM